MKHKESNIFWLSYSDLMTSLFFIMLVLFAITYLVWNRNSQKLKNIVEIQKKQLAIVNAVDNALKPLKRDTSLFRYDTTFQRFTLGFDVEFAKNKFRLVPGELKSYDATLPKIKSAGAKLKSIIDNLLEKKENDTTRARVLKDVNYVLVIAGYASHTGQSMEHNYLLSYQRAYSLWSFWKSNGIDFENSKYKGLIDLQISGNGWGGVGRILPDNSEKNQRFIIMLMPKIGDITRK